MLCFTDKAVTDLPTLVCFHTNCTDGFTAATIAYMIFGDNADYLGVQYNKEYDLEIFKDKNVFVLDFSFPLDTCNEIKKVSKNFVILDHHKTAQESLSTLDYAIFDMNKSGALLTWNYFYPSYEAPKFVQLVSDHDLWNHHSKEVVWFNKAIRCLPFDFTIWLDTFKSFQDPLKLEEFIAQGKAIETFTNQQVESLVKVATTCVINGEQGLMVNAASAFISETGNQLAKKSGTFGAITILAKNGKVLVSLRSIGDYDVSNIAKEFGGGGHKNAAGFSIDLKDLQFVDEKFIINK
jgi:oligoribonuclease NrnB/cAMP/cGMP phosphodiesterase (DHH superfamily)